MSIVNGTPNIEMNMDLLPRFQGFSATCVDDSTSFGATGVNGISAKTLLSSSTTANVLNLGHHWTTTAVSIKPAPW